MPTKYTKTLRPPYGEPPDEPVRCMVNQTDGEYIDRYRFEPGNGTLYDLIYARRLTPPGETDTCIEGEFVVVWVYHVPCRAMVFTDTLIHYSYVMEKMGLNEADAVGILMFLEQMGHLVAYPKPYAVSDTGTDMGVDRNA